MTNPLPAPIDYTTKDFSSFKAAMLQYASRTFPEWTQASEGDFGMLLVELFAYSADILSYYGDRVANEAFLPTATQKRSVLNIADLLAYTPAGALAATGTVTLTNSSTVPVVVPALTLLSTDFVNEIDAPIYFETQADVTVPANGGTVVANVIQGQTITNEILGTSTGLIDQFFILQRGPVLDGTVLVYVGNDSLGWFPWTLTQNLIDASPLDTMYSTWRDENDAVYVKLGDNVNGAVPSTGLSIKATYRIGGGLAGNIASGKLTTLVSAIDGISVATDTNGIPISSLMIGGADPESINQIRVNAPKSFRTQNRLVSIQDFKEAALGVAAVMKANALAANYTNVSVYIVGPDGQTNTALVNTTYNYLNAPVRKMAGATVSVAAATLIPVNVTYSLGVLPQYSTTTVKNAVQQAIQHVLALVNQDLGGRVTAASIYNAVANVPGVAYALLSNLARNDATQGVVADAVMRDWEIATVGTITNTITEGGF